MVSPALVDLVHPPPYGEVPFKHLGLSYVAAGLRANGFDTRYHDLSERHHRAGTDFYDDLILRLSQRAGDMSDLPLLELLSEVLFPEHVDSPLAETIRRQARDTLEGLSDAKVVGISFNTLTAYFTAVLGRGLRERGVIVLLGGPLAGFRPVSELMLRLGAADALLAGDGDLHAAAVIRALVHGRPLSDVPGAVWLEDGAFRANAPAPPALLDALPWPELEGSVLDQFIPLQASRGCGRSCAYCSESGIWGEGGYRRRAPANVVEEMVARSNQYGLTDFHFHDDLLNCNKGWMKELVDTLAKHSFTWESFFEPYGLDEDLLARMRDAGCRLVKYGIQSFSPALLRRMKRPPNIRDVVDVVVKTYQLGMSTHYDMLIGHPGETEEDHRRNLELVEELFGLTGERLHFSLNPFYLSAGSEIQRHPDRFGLIVRHADPNDYATDIASALRAAPPYPIGYRSGLARETTMRRMDELAEILRRHGKDYLYLGQREVPGVSGQPRRMLPEVGEAKLPSTDKTTRGARAIGDGDLALPALVLRNDSNLRLFPDPGRVRVVAGPSDGLAGYVAALQAMAPGGKLRVLGGEPTLNADLPRVLTAARRASVTCVVETNGLRFGAKRFTEAMVRHGLSHAVVVLLGADADKADALGGVQGSFDLALAGARLLMDAGAHVEVGLAVSEATLDSLHELSQLAADRLPGAAALRVIVTGLRGREAPGPADPARIEKMVACLLAKAASHGQHVVLEDRG